MKLAAWLKLTGLTTYQLGRLGVASQASLDKYVAGGVPMKSVAKRIVRATHGAVTLKDLGVKE